MKTTLNKNEQPIHLLKLTGLGAYSKNSSISQVDYRISLSENLISVPVNEDFVLCSLKCEDKKLNFYFTANMVTYFCYEILKIKIPHAKYAKEMFKHFYPIFIDAFVSYLNTESGNTFTLISARTAYQEAYNLLFFQMESKNNRFQFYIENNDPKFITQFLSAFHFEKQLLTGNKINTRFLKLSYPVEIGVTYLDRQNLNSIEQNDIILLDKVMNVEKDNVCINFNQAVSVKATTLSDDKIKILSEIKDW
jgi:hypothetical protein